MKFILNSFIGILFIGFLFISCTSKIKIQSVPSDAEIFISQQNSLERKSLGKTPLEISVKDFSEKAGGQLRNGEFYILTIESKDCESEKILLPPQPFGVTETQVIAKLIPLKEGIQAKGILERLHNAQKFAQGGQFERALMETDKVLEIDSKLTRALSMKGSIYYLQKKYDEALTWFDKAIIQDPSFEEAVHMINKIKAEKKK